MARMNKNFDTALQRCLESLVYSLPSILDVVLLKMNTRFLDHQKEIIRAQQTSVLKVTEFVKILSTMQDDAFFAFLTALDQLGYRHVANEIRLAAKIAVPPPPHSTISLSSGGAGMTPDSSTVTEETNILSQKPKVDLIRGVCDYIAAHWMDIAYCLDFDDDGYQVDLFEKQGNRVPMECCMVMLKTWIRGTKGKEPKTWQTLLDILLTLDYKSAHDKVKEHLQYVQSKQQKNSQESVKVSVPEEETNPDTSLSSSSGQSIESIRRHMNNMSLPRESVESEAPNYPGGPSED